MAIKIIPITTGVRKFKLRVSLSGLVYGLRIRFNSRMSRWVADLLDASDTTLVTGCPLLLGTPLFDEYVGPSALAGTLFMLNKESQYIEASEDELGESAVLLYSDD